MIQWSCVACSGKIYCVYLNINDKNIKGIINRKWLNSER